MMTTRLTLRSILGVIAVPLSALLTLAVVLNAPIAQANHPEHFEQPGQPDHTTAPAGPNDVTIAGFAFNPAVITVTAGSTVMWTNTDPFTHTTTSDIGSLDPWDSGQLGQNGTFSKVFNTPGTYNYHCTIHFLTMFGTVIVVAAQPPTSVDIAGPTTGGANVTQFFTATVSPVSTTQPITYVWEATGQAPITHSNGGLNDSIGLAWPPGTAGSQLITVTAMNSLGNQSNSHGILITPTVMPGITDVSIAFPAFNPAVITISVGSSVRWTNTDPFTHTTTSDIGSLDPWDSGQLGPNGIFTKTFNTPGTYPYHCDIHPIMQGTVIVIGPQSQPPTEVTIDGPTEGVIDTAAYTFTATINPVTATQPITYMWQATGQSDVAHLGGITDTIVFTWAAGTMGTQLITTTASNDGGSVTGTHFIIFGASKIYLPLVMR